MSEFVGLTPVYLSARFKEETGIGFSDYLNQYRIEVSKKLLAETDEKIATIARMTGYSNSRYYSRVFKNSEGIRPMDYRISIRKNGARKDC
ncbi:MAG TPA: helix-turn-helix transcriptional regulator [Candidatus Eisenbergiella pullicola]|nr:helix-turn-helix transcriptional regulator [Candidatus Eisenbergiella pullicola]